VWRGPGLGAFGPEYDMAVSLSQRATIRTASGENSPQRVEKTVRSGWRKQSAAGGENNLQRVEKTIRSGWKKLKEKNLIAADIGHQKSAAQWPQAKTAATAATAATDLGRQRRGLKI
jgi:hypothetical protein